VHPNTRRSDAPGLRKAWTPAARAIAAALPLLLCAGTAWASALFDPALKFRTLRTRHFVIYYHQGEEPMARRLTIIAEETWRTLSRPLGVTPPPLTHVVLADQTEFANGYATPVPYDTVVIYPVWPAGAEWDFEDWLRLAFTHEFTHIVHLDRSEGWARIARNMFGRAVYAFPNVFLPLWQIEGLATYEESVVTGHGRLHAGDYRAIVGEQARTNTLEPLDRINGGLTDWPAGATQYAYGVGFHDYLANGFGADKIADLATATARRFPYTSTRAFADVYGEPLGDLFREYENSLLEAVKPPAAVDADVRRVTREGFWITGPRFDRFACAGCPPDIVYSARNPDGFPALYRVALDGSAHRQMAERYLGSTTAIGRDVIVFDQVERRRDVGFYSDLYALSRSDGAVRPLTREARLLDPDFAPDGTRIVCTQNRPGERDLVLVRLKPDPTSVGAGDSDLVRLKPDATNVGAGFSRPGATSVGAGFSRPNSTVTIVPLVAEPDVFFDAPRWSPDGRTIAAERHRAGALPDIVLVDVDTRTLRAVASNPRVRFTMPAWRPDGRALVAAAARGEETFNLVEIPLDGSAIRQITHTTGGATWPDVSADGSTIVFAGYTASGYDLFTMPYPRDLAAREPFSDLNLVPASQRHDGADAADAANLPSTDYSPIGTLLPTSWTPVIDNDGVTIRVGGAVSGTDVLGYHLYSARASWLVSTTTNAPLPGRTTPDWQVYYEYDRWRPRFYAAASQQTTFSVGPAAPSGTATDSTLRETSVEAGVLLPFLHARTQHSVLGSIVRSHEDFMLPAELFARDRTALRASWQTLTARNYGYGISPEDGVALGATSEIVRRALGSDADATTYTGDVRIYLPGALAHHVVAVRVAGGVSTGDPTVGRTFVLGGSSPAVMGDFGSRAASLLRGFPDATFAGTRVAVANAEYRFPVYRLERGFGTWPIFFHTFHGALFADAGEAWSSAFRAASVKTSVGIEASADIIAAYFAQLTVSAGAALGHDRAGVLQDRATLYVRIGKSF